MQTNNILGQLQVNHTSNLYHNYHQVCSQNPNCQPLRISFHFFLVCSYFAFPWKYVFKVKPVSSFDGVRVMNYTPV